MNPLYVILVATLAAAPVEKPATPTAPQSSSLLDYIGGKPCLNASSVRFVANARVAYYMGDGRQKYPGLRQDDVDDAFTKVFTARGYTVLDYLAPDQVGPDPTVILQFRSLDAGEYLNLGFQLEIKEGSGRDVVTVYTDRQDRRLEKKTGSIDFTLLDTVAQQLIIPTCAYQRKTAEGTK